MVLYEFFFGEVEEVGLVVFIILRVIGLVEIFKIYCCGGIVFKFDVI